MQSRIDSLALIETSVWHELQQAALQPGHEWRTMALATIDGDVAPARTVTIAATVCPSRSSGTPNTSASSTPGCSRTTCSTSGGKTFSPPRLITDVPRPISTSLPSGPIRPRSPGIT